ncbi:unnamed protein product [marine sediment metagenome]|uniref:Uncharacterized protein n=1 Tax=marine sediment metagenome TaxID=412755 RepID=X1H4N0_9ZZZZ
MSKIEMVKTIEVLTNTLKEIRMNGEEELETAILKKIHKYIGML